MDWRERRAEQEKGELERLHGVRERLAQSRLGVKSELETLSRQAAGTEGTTAEALHQIASFSRSLLNLDGRLKAEESGCHAEIVTQREKCLTADRDHQLLVQLHQNKKQIWNYEANREIEEIAADSWNSGRARQTNVRK